MSDEEENIVGYINSPHDSSDGEDHKKKQSKKNNSKKNVGKSKEKDAHLNEFNNGGQDSEISEKIQGEKHNFKNSQQDGQSQNVNEDDK